MRHLYAAALVAAGLAGAPALADDIKIAHVYGKTGALEAYAKQSHTGFMMGLEYATDGTMEIDGRKIVVIEKDTQLKPDIGKALLAHLPPAQLDALLANVKFEPRTQNTVTTEAALREELAEIAETGVTPAETLLDLYAGRWNESVDPVFTEFAY